MAEGRDDCRESCSSASSNSQELEQTRSNDMADLSEAINRIISEIFYNPDGLMEEASFPLREDVIKILTGYIHFLRRSAENIRDNVVIMNRQEPEFQRIRNNIRNAVQGIISDYPRYREECDTESLKAIITVRLREVVSMIDQSFRKQGEEVFDDFKAPEAPAPRKTKRDKSKSPKKDDP